MLKNRVEGKRLILSLDASLYSKDAIFKCLYWYTGKYSTQVELKDNFYTVELRSIKELKEEELIDALHHAERDFVDFNLRDIVSKETQNIRDLLVAKAFSHGEFDETPPGVISDPVGFDVNKKP